MRESELSKHILLAASKIGQRLFRNNVGQSWIGKSVIAKRRMSVELEVGDVVVRQARRFHAGLCEGSSDYIGWTPVKITADMIGKEVAVFTAVEVKTRTGRPTDKQIKFLSAVGRSGGFGTICRSPEEAASFAQRCVDGGSLT